MNGLTLETPVPRFIWPAWREHGFALGVALALHAGLAYVLLNLSHQAPMPVPVTAVLTTQLITLPAPDVAPAAPVHAEPPAPEPMPLPVQEPEPVVQAPVVEQADLAFKRVEQERQEKARQVQRERQQREQRLRDERLAREQQLQALKEQQLAQARQAEAERLAAAERQAAANAAATARAEAEAASRQYLPIAKQAPDYPARALERKIEGECTVAYTVTAAGRVEDPQVVGNCHPMFVKPSLAAAKTFRYQPRVVNGQAVAVANVKNTFSYRIQ
ncbi:energy transducer TonB [Pseudomonas argentinensis]|uniref:Protein TonB n=1 Tax=Phytopseudomonas argentinensis TaxID=289370 RepID=A0A1I3N5Z9_9GAMM|nr:energy transducer TonB [Pseudomonas argentinensis]KAB0550141.1 energy transducer TonB [Pseudomonas argentinensis]SFJ04713.1 outer membrane transport energization protein TonB [Pseudomonas argentinensis]